MENSGQFWEKVGDFGKKKVDKKIFRAAAAKAAAAKAAAAKAAAAKAAANKNTNKLRFQESLVAELLLLLLELSGKLL